MIKTPKGLYNKIHGMIDSLSTEDFKVVECKDTLNRELTVINRKSNAELTISFYPGSFQGNYHVLRVHNSAKDNDKIYTDEPRFSPEPWCREHCCTLVLDYVEEFIKSKEKSDTTNPTSLTSLCENIYKRILDTGYNKAQLTKSPNTYEIQLNSDEVTFNVYFDLYNNMVTVMGVFRPSSNVLSKLDKDIFTEFKGTTGDLAKYEQKLMKNIMIVVNNESSKSCYKELEDNSNSSKSNEEKISALYKDLRDLVLDNASNFLEEHKTNECTILSFDTIRGHTEIDYIKYPGQTSLDVNIVANSWELYVNSQSSGNTIDKLSKLAKSKLSKWLNDGLLEEEKQDESRKSEDGLKEYIKEEANKEQDDLKEWVKNFNPYAGW